MSDNLGLDQVAASQNQKEITINDAFGQVDAAMTELLVLDYSGDPYDGIMLTDEEFRRHLIFRTEGLTSINDLEVPAIKRDFVVDNSGGASTVRVVRGATEVPVGAGLVARFYADGTADGLIVQSSVEGAAAAPPYDLGFFFPGEPPDGALLASVVMVRSVAFPADFAGSRGFSGVNPDATATITIERDATAVGTIEIGAAGAFTFASSGGSEVEFVAGERLRLIAPSPKDDTLANVSITLQGTR